jgi:hypothetical protein
MTVGHNEHINLGGDIMTQLIVETPVTEAEVRANLWAEPDHSVWDSREAMLEAGEQLCQRLLDGQSQIIPVQQDGKTIWITHDDPMGQDAVREVNRHTSLMLWRDGILAAVKRDGVIVGFKRTDKKFTGFTAAAGK